MGNTLSTTFNYRTPLTLHIILTYSLEHISPFFYNHLREVSTFRPAKRRAQSTQFN